MNTRFGDGAAFFLAKALAQNKVLLSIDLSYNFISDKGAIHISQAFASNQSVQEIFIKENQIGAIGLEALQKALEGSSILNMSIMPTLEGDKKKWEKEADRIIEKIDSINCMLVRKRQIFYSFPGATDKLLNASEKKLLQESNEIHVFENDMCTP